MSDLMSDEEYFEHNQDFNYMLKVVGIIQEDVSKNELKEIKKNQLQLKKDIIKKAKEAIKYFKKKYPDEFYIEKHIKIN